MSDRRLEAVLATLPLLRPRDPVSTCANHTERSGGGASSSATYSSRTFSIRNPQGSFRFFGQASLEMQIFDQIEQLAKDPQARGAISAMLKRIDLNLWLRFVEGKKGNRAVRRVAGGLITSGDDPLPVRPYGGTGEDDNVCDDGGRTALVGAATGALPAVSDEASSANVGQQEDVSLSKVHRGDETPIELFIAEAATLNMALQRQLTAVRPTSP